MQRPLDLYAIFRLKDIKLTGELNRLMSGKSSSVKRHEIESLRGMADALIMAGATVNELDGYYFSYIIPKIGKEFDVLRISEDTVLNIELKYVNVGRDEIADQLKRNEYYLKALGKKIFSCTYVYDENCFYAIGSDGQLSECSPSNVMEAVRATNRFYRDDPDRLFDPEDFIFSPLTEPQRFLSGGYFLTQHQESIEKRLLGITLDGVAGFAAVSGGSGTGKTLLLYDMALKASRLEKVCVIASDSSSASEGFKSFADFDITDAQGYISELSVNTYRLILIDDAHMIPKDQLELIVKESRVNGSYCVFFTEASTLLLAVKRTEVFWSFLNRLVGAEKHQLTDKIRTDPTVAMFINRILNRELVTARTEGIEYGDVFVLYAANRNEARKMAEHYAQKGYYSYSPIGSSSKQPPSGKRLLLLGRSFYYDENEKLRSAANDKDNIMEKLVFNGLKGIDGGLGIIAVGNLQLFKKILSLFK